MLLRMVKKLSPFIILFILILDQLSKFLVLKHWQMFPLSLAPFFDLVLVWNRGLSFGILNTLSYPWISYVLGTFVLGVLGYVGLLLVREKKESLVLAYSFIIGGGLGNLIDRVIHGAVVDFLDFYIMTYHWPAFNVADSFVVVGVALYTWVHFCHSSTKYN
ncbi:MAG: signal peptidase II [Alphaproteobacteria bacterium]